MYSDFVFLDRFLFELSCKNTHTHTHTHTHTESNEYPIVAFSKNATIMKMSSRYHWLLIYDVKLTTKIDGMGPFNIVTLE